MLSDNGKNRQHLRQDVARAGGAVVGHASIESTLEEFDDGSVEVPARFLQRCRNACDLVRIYVLVRIGEQLLGQRRTLLGATFSLDSNHLTIQRLHVMSILENDFGARLLGDPAPAVDPAIRSAVLPDTAVPHQRELETVVLMALGRVHGFVREFGPQLSVSLGRTPRSKA